MDKEVVSRLKQDYKNSALLSKKYGKELRGKKYTLWTARSKLWIFISVFLFFFALPGIRFTVDKSYH